MPDTLDNPDELARAVEACLFAAEEPLTREQISAHLGDAEVKDALAALQEQYAKRGINLVERGKRWAFQTAPDLAHILRREKDQLRRLSRAATEVLAIIAYHEPVSRAEIEAIRGVQTSGGTLDVLMEAGWVRVAGRREVPGRPVIYATTPEFLAHFGLESRKDLPGLAELKASGLLDPVDDAYEDLMDQRTAENTEVNASPDRDSGEDRELHDGSVADALEKPDESA
ncbi:SMC-Scp complex subunit ScpB [Aurantiacibacter odishensis]|uniref:SMC-Scp complex subunit ScpB n=1 Tax=Aurantiacibacter odishensis TaxID=1155476 RepID=UPI000E7238C7|nr:SMC-Scp complex subunit ScpB [Aurantiacibacter odishensis]